MVKKLLLLLVAVLALASCAGRRGPPVIGLTLPGLQFPFFVTMKADFDSEATQLGVKVVYIDAQNDSSKQVAAVESFISQKVSGILISPMTTDSLVPAIEEAVKAGIPVATVDRKANTDAMLVHVGADNVEGGRAAARFVVDKLKGKGTIIELEGTPGASPAIDRKKGFDEVIAQNPGLKIIVSQAADFDRAKANTVMENLIQAHPKFDAVFGANDEMIIGAIEAMSAAKIDPAKKVTVGYDATPDAMTYIKQGKLGATVDQFPGKQAAQALSFLVDSIKSKKQPPQKVIYIQPQAVTTAP
ncbi:MAG: substrate-binding domain-containing protein [Spirochaetia bacterium]|jgi:ribose transport system substrate-binding protein